MSDDVAALKKRIVQLESENVRLKETLTKSSAVSSKGQERDSAFWTDAQYRMANDTDSIKSQLRNGSLGVNDYNATGDTMLHYCGSQGMYALAQYLINLGADLNARNNENLTPLDVAYERNNHHMQRLYMMSSMDAEVGNRITSTSVELKRIQGVNENIVQVLNAYDKDTREFFRDSLVDIVTKIIAKKAAFSDVLLNLSWQFLKINKEDPLESKLWSTLRETCLSIIQNANKRDWYYFKTFILPSNIWYEKVVAEQDAESEEYLYYRLLGLVSDQSKKQIVELKQNMDKLIQKDEGAWTKLISWDIPDGDTKPRQDCVPNGIGARYTQMELIQIPNTSQFKPLAFYDYNQYLSRLILCAQTVDDEFQKSVQRIFDVNAKSGFGKLAIGDDEKGDGVFSYMRGSVKLMERARSKAENDYASAEWPTTACVLDLNRCSLVFDDIASLLAALKLFENKVKYYQSGCIIGIVRDKNGFQEYVKETQYADIKLNVLIKGSKNNIIGEVQFLLSTMKRFKDKVHNLYGITREQEYFEKSVGRLLPILMDKDKELFIAGSMGDTQSLCSLMTVSNVTQKDIMKTDATNDTILGNICYLGHYKAYQFVKNVIDRELFLERLFLKSIYSQTPIDYAAVSSPRCSLKIAQSIFLDDDVVQRFQQSDEECTHMLYWLLRNGDAAFIQFVFGALGIRTQQKVTKLLSMDVVNNDTTNAGNTTEKPLIAAIESNEEAQAALENMHFEWQ